MKKKSHSLMPYRPKPGYYGQFNTDMLIELYFPDKTDGLCIEIGGADGVKGSNSLLFEEKGWTAICIEPNPILAQTARCSRENVLEFACGAENKSSVPFEVFKIGDNKIMSSLSSLDTDPRLIKEYDDAITERYSIDVEVKTLNTILEFLELDRHIDFITIDTEGTELDVLIGFDLERWSPDLVVVENNYQDDYVNTYMDGRGYKQEAWWIINEFYTKKN
jgi:FkbM family methyltransferase